MRLFNESDGRSSGYMLFLAGQCVAHIIHTMVASSIKACLFA